MNTSSAKSPNSSFSLSERSGRVSSLVKDLEAVANCLDVTLMRAATAQRHETSTEPMTNGEYAYATNIYPSRTFCIPYRSIIYFFLNHILYKNSKRFYDYGFCLLLTLHLIFLICCNFSI